MSATYDNRPKGVAQDLTPTRRRFLRDASAEAGKVRLGVVLPLSGQFALAGQNIRRGYDFAVEDLNKAGGIKSLGGATIELVYGDNQGKQDVAIGETERLIQQEKVSAIM